MDRIFEILQPDGTPIGSLMTMGFDAGPPPPGAPVSFVAGNNVITGGTGAFLGARGQLAGAGPPTNRDTSVREDPSRRRVNGGGKGVYYLHLIPLQRPEVVSTSNGPAVAHSQDFTLVSASNPAVAGEILSLFVRGLGPVRASIDPGQPFPSNPPAPVNSPVEIAVNGKPAEVLGAVGYPASTDTYQVNFRMPTETAKGLASIQLTVAWVAGTPVTVAVQ